MMESLPLAELDAIMTTDILVAEGVRQYLLEHQLTIPIISFDSIKPRLDIEAYIDINAVELGRESVRTILQIIKDHKEGKLFATVNWLTIPLRNFRSLYVYIYCLFRWPRPWFVSKKERSISFLFIGTNQGRLALIPVKTSSGATDTGDYFLSPIPLELGEEYTIYDAAGNSSILHYRQIVRKPILIKPSPIVEKI